MVQASTSDKIRRSEKMLAIDVFKYFQYFHFAKLPKICSNKNFLIDGQDDNGLGLHLLTVGSNSQERGGLKRFGFQFS